MNIAKLKSNRKLMQEFDTVAISRASILSLVYLAVYAYLTIVADILQNYFKFTLCMLFGLLILTGWRFYILLRIANFYASGLYRWRRIFFLMGVIHVSLFSGLIFFGVLQLGESFYSWCLLVWVMGIGLLQGRIWVAHVQLNILQQSLLLIPLLVVFVSIASPSSLMAAGTLGLFYLWLIKTAERDHANFWQQQLQSWIIQERQRNLEIAEVKLARLCDGRQDFLTDLSHEVRTPMTSVLGMMTLLSDMGLNEHQQETLHVAQRAGESLLTLIDDIIDFSRIASGAIVLESSVFNLRKCVDDALETLGPLAHAKRLELCCLFDKSVPMRVRGDSQRIRQILLNLISPVIKFSEDGEIIIKVHMQLISASEGLLRVDIVDQGKCIGNDEERRQLLFQAFHKADVASGRSTGASLGLAICNGLAEAMHGQIGLISESEKCSVVWFTANLYLSTQQTQVCQYQDLVGKRVLIYGAPPGITQMLELELNYWQMPVDAISADYDQALQALRNAARSKNAYDLLIINMGYVYQEALKLSTIVAEDPALISCKQIFLVALDQRNSLDHVKLNQSASTLSMIVKPIKQIDLQRVLNEIFDLKHKADTPIFLPQANVQQQNNFKILLVEDNDVNQMVEKGMLNRLGFAAKIASDGCQAIDMLHQEHFDLVLMDCQMPNMDGYQATSRIRQQESIYAEHIPIIAMTANAVDGEETRCLAVGMDDVLFKPVNLSDLESKLRYWLSQSKTGVDMSIQPLTNQPTLH